MSDFEVVKVIEELFRNPEVIWNHYLLHSSEIRNLANHPIMKIGSRSMNQFQSRTLDCFDDLSCSLLAIRLVSVEQNGQSSLLSLKNSKIS